MTDTAAGVPLPIWLLWFTRRAPDPQQPKSPKKNGPRLGWIVLLILLALISTRRRPAKVTAFNIGSLNRQVGRRQIRLTAGNSDRVTRQGYGCVGG
jgi:hypothetical protein